MRRGMRLSDQHRLRGTGPHVGAGSLDVHVITHTVKHSSVRLQRRVRLQACRARRLMHLGTEGSPHGPCRPHGGQLYLVELYLCEFCEAWARINA